MADHFSRRGGGGLAPDGGPTVARRLSEHPTGKLLEAMTTGVHALGLGLVLAVTSASSTFPEDALSAAVSHDLLDRVVAEPRPRLAPQLFADPALRDADAASATDGAEGWASRAVKAHAEAAASARSGGCRATPRSPSKVPVLAARSTPPASCCSPSTATATRRRDPSPRRRRRPDAASRATLVAEAVPEFDAWVLAGWRAETRRRGKALRDAEAPSGAEQEALPLDALHRLTSNVAGDARDAKRLCAALCGLGAADQVEPGARPRAGAGRSRRSTLEGPQRPASGYALYLHDVDREVVSVCWAGPRRRAGLKGGALRGRRDRRRGPLRLRGGGFGAAFASAGFAAFALASAGFASGAFFGRRVTRKKRSA